MYCCILSAKDLTMGGDTFNLGCVARQRGNKIVSGIPKQLSATQRSSTDLPIFIDFPNDNSMFRATMAQVMLDVSSTTVVTQKQERWMVIKQMDFMTLSLPLTQNFVTFQSKRVMSKMGIVRRIITETFRDVGLLPEIKRFDKALKQFSSGVGNNRHKGISINDSHKDETSLCNYEDDAELLPVVDASHLCAQKTICLETLKVDDAQDSKEPFDAWMDAVKKKAMHR